MKSLKKHLNESMVMEAGKMGALKDMFSDLETLLKMLPEEQMIEYGDAITRAYKSGNKVEMLKMDDSTKFYIKSIKMALIASDGKAKLKPVKSVEDFVNEAKADDGDGEVENEVEFKSYAMSVLKKVHGEDFDKSKADATINGLIKKYGGDNEWGDAIGALQSGLDK